MQTNISKIYKDKTILITGGTGYIGSCLTHALSKIDCNLKVLGGSSSSCTQYGFFRVKINNY